ncbi:MAG: hypothetical protein Q9224_002523, partial [Gallowayella concinna]
AARGRSTLNLQDVTGRCDLLTTLTCSSTPRSLISTASLLSPSDLMRSVSVGMPLTVTYLRWRSRSSHRCSKACLPAAKNRNNAARMMRKMQVPAYTPVPPGVQFEENSEVDDEEKNVMDIIDIGIDDDDAGAGAELEDPDVDPWW